MGCHPSHWRTYIFQDGYCTTNQWLKSILNWSRNEWSLGTPAPVSSEAVNVWPTKTSSLMFSKTSQSPTLRDLKGKSPWFFLYPKLQLGFALAITFAFNVAMNILLLWTCWYFRVEVHHWNKIGVRMESKGFLCSAHPIQPLIVLVISVITRVMTTQN